MTRHRGNAVLQSIFLIVSLCDVSLDHCQLHLDLSFRQHPAGCDPL